AVRPGDLAACATLRGLAGTRLARTSGGVRGDRAAYSPRVRSARRSRMSRGERNIQRSVPATAEADSRRSRNLLVDRYAAALRLEDEESTARRVPPDGVGPLFRRDRLQVNTRTSIERGNGSGSANGAGATAEDRAVRPHVGSAGQR